MIRPDLSDIIQRLCRVDSDDLVVSKEHTEAACKWMQDRIWSLEREIEKIREDQRAAQIAVASARPAKPRLGEIRK